MMHDTFRLPLRNARALAVVDNNRDENARLPFGVCFMIWVGLIATSWAGIAIVVSLIS